MTRSVEAWFRTAERRPADGEVVLAYFEADANGAEMWIVLEHHNRPARHELNSHVWHSPGNDEDDYSIPTCWRYLDRPLSDEDQLK